MNIRKYILMTLTSVTSIAGMSVDAQASEWLCSEGTGPVTKAICYVSSVRFQPGLKPYVRAKLHDPEGDADCEYIQIRYGDGASTVEALRGSEAVLLVALTTGLPIKFYSLEQQGEDCYASSIIVAKPGH